MNRYADVVFPVALVTPLTYALPEAGREAARPGIRVRAPLGRRTAVGFIVRVHDTPPAAAEVKPIAELIDSEPVVPADILELAGRLSRRYYSSWGELLRAALPPSRAASAPVRAALTDAGRAVLAEDSLKGSEAAIIRLLAGKDHSPAFFKNRKIAADGPAVLARLVRRGLVETRTVEKRSSKRAAPAAPQSPVQLDLDFARDDAVDRAAAFVAAAAGSGDDRPILLFGPAARRNPVYLRCLRDVLARGRQALYLVPEIGLLGGAAELLATGLGERAVLLHSRLSDRQRELARRRAEELPAAVVVGPRSALFTPLPRLGLIIVDEESDESYLQTESPAYDTREGARMRAQAARIPLLLGSDAPTVEAFERAGRNGRLFDLNGGRALVSARIVDDRSERGLLSRPLRAGVRAALEAKAKAVLFVLRRGYASFLFCPRCGHVPKCGRCDVALTLYQKSRRLECRICGAAEPAPSACPRCGGRILEPRGAGVEAVEGELRRAFPAARIAALDSDRVRTRGARDRLVEKYARGSVDVLIGTPLLAHRADAARASFVAVVNPENLLAQSDFRAGHRVFVEIRRMLRFLDERDSAARAVLQTSFPDHPVLRAAASGDYRGFFERDLEYRRLLGYPPFAALAEIVLWGKDEREIGRRAKELAGRLRAAGLAEVLGPASTRFRGSRGAQVLVKTETVDRLDDGLAGVLPAVRTRMSVVRFD